MEEDIRWMDEALKEARKAFDEGEIPIGAVVVAGGRVVGRGHNMTEALTDVTAHAEMIAITAAEASCGKYLDKATLYVTVEPCLMCAGAIGWSQLGRIVWGTDDPRRGFSVLCRKEMSPFHPKASLCKGVREKECRQLMLDFFLQRRGKNL